MQYVLVARLLDTSEFFAEATGRTRARALPSTQAIMEALEQRLLLCGVSHAEPAAAAGAVLTASPALHLEPENAAPPADTLTTANPAETFSLDSLPELHSRPEAHAQLYLSFDGDETRAWGDFSPGRTPAFDRDGDPGSFTAAELDAIDQIWSRVAEKFSPFNINVTTVDPGNLNNRETLKVVIGGDGQWFGEPTGGVAYVGSFNDTHRRYGQNAVFVFSDNLANGHPKLVAEAVAHEAGHGFGLHHQAMWNGGVMTAEYSAGAGNRAPIMGDSFDAPRGLWWAGRTAQRGGPWQDDMAILAGSRNGFGHYEDHGDTAATATGLSIGDGAFTAEGVIHETWDRDYFSFAHAGGDVTFRADVAPHGPMLNLNLQLRDGMDNLITTAGTSELGGSINRFLEAGLYYLVVMSNGEYGDVGQYTLSGEVEPDVTPPTAALAVSQPTPGESNSIFTVTYSDDVAVDVATLGDANLRVTGPNDYDQLAELLSVDESVSGTSRTATYRITAPGGAWTNHDNGSYRISLLANQVADTAGNFAAAGTLGSFTVSIAEPPGRLAGDANGDGRVDGADLLIWQANFGIQSGALRSNGSFNGDGRVDGEDFLIWQANFSAGNEIHTAVLAGGQNDAILGTSAARSLVAGLEAQRTAGQLGLFSSGLIQDAGDAEASAGL